MRLVTFLWSGVEGIGVLTDDGNGIADLRGAGIPNSMQALVAGGEEALARLREALATAPVLQIGDVCVLAPLPRPARNIFCVGKNYFEHAREFQGSGFDQTSNAEVRPEAPIVFTKAPSSVSAPGAPIPTYLDPTDTSDYEGELAVVIGRGGRGIKREEAMGHIFGYTIINDVTARELQKRHKQWFLGKSIDGYCPMGPALLTADEVPDVTALRVVTRVNGEERQSASVADLMFDIPELIAVISSGITLQSGDIIATGTPAGVGIGFEPPRFLRAGDEVAIEIDPIGVLRNPVE